MMKKNFLVVNLIVITVTAFFVACEKENPEPVTTGSEVTLAIDDSESEMVEDYHISMEEFPTEADREQEKRRLMNKYADLSSDRDDCFDAAWEYGTNMAASFARICEYITGEPPYPELHSFNEWKYTNEYYEEHCE